MSATITSTSAPAPRTHKKVLLIVEGNISAGKSTLARQLSQSLNYALFLEPTVANPFLEKFYADPKKYALPMQLWLLKQRFVTYVNALKFLVSDDQTGVDGVLLDRSIFSDIVFAEKNFVDGNFSREGFDYYLALRRKLLHGLPAPHAVLYLDVTPETCYDRIHNMRQRSCEGGIPLDYLAGLDSCYQSFLQRMDHTSKVMRLNWESFGDPDALAASLATEAFADSPKDPTWLSLDTVSRFIFDAPAVNAAMRMPHTIPEAGADVEVDDPDVITRKEAPVVPDPSLRTPLARGPRKRRAPGALDSTAAAAPSSAPVSAAATPTEDKEDLYTPSSVAADASGRDSTTPAHAPDADAASVRSAASTGSDAPAPPAPKIQRLHARDETLQAHAISFS